MNIREALEEAVQWIEDSFPEGDDRPGSLVEWKAALGQIAPPPESKCRFCVTCDHLIPQDPQHPELHLDIARCNHTDFAKRSLSLVSGKEVVFYPFAEHERANAAEGHCGPEGKMWEPKEEA